MSIPFDIFKMEITKNVENELRVLSADMKIPDIYSLMTTPPKFELGQLALPCFIFAKELKQPPAKIASELAAKLKNLPLVEKIDAVGGYLNFHCKFETLAETILPQVISGEYFKKKFLASNEVEKIIVEYSQPNTHKAMHVGHLRCLVLGDSVCSLLAFAGHNVLRTTYPGDMGAHIAKTLWYIKKYENGKLPTSDHATWLGKIYILADEVLKNELGTPKEAGNRAELTKILAELENGEGEFFEMWKITRDWSLNEMKRVYEWLDAQFDIWFFESECDKPSRELVKQKFEEGFFVKDDGAIGIDLSDHNLGFAMFLKSDGNGLYLTKDLELIKQKFSLPGVTSSIVVIDFRQARHFQQLYKTAELMGYPQAKKSSALLYETVNTEDGKPFSSRSGTGNTLGEVREKMEAKVTQDYLERYRGQWRDEEIQKTAEMVTIGALKYGLIRVDNNTAINFDLNEWLKLDGETGPYLQYVHARCHQIIEKQGKPEAIKNFKLEDKTEKELLFMIHRFNEFAVSAAATLRPSVLAGYLYDLAKAFNRFYEACPIRSSEGDLKNTRLLLVQAVAKSIKNGLGILKIPVPEKM